MDMVMAMDMVLAMDTMVDSMAMDIDMVRGVLRLSLRLMLTMAMVDMVLVMDMVMAMDLVLVMDTMVDTMAMDMDMDMAMATTVKLEVVKKTFARFLKLLIIIIKRKHYL